MVKASPSPERQRSSVFLQPLAANQVDEAARTLAEAFQDDPLLTILVAQDAAKRRRVAPWFFRASIKYGRRHGQVWSNSDASAAAIWLPPGQTTIRPLGMIRAGMAAMPFKVGFRGMRRFVEAIGAMEGFHRKIQGPHWYLLAIGTRRDRQGQGFGSALLDVGVAAADGAGIPVYLETATDDDVAFYSKRGFRIIGEAEVSGFVLRGMVRDPLPG